jgi:putative oxidoreductase
MLTPHLNIDVALLIGRCLLAALFLQSSITKSAAWQAALDEIESFGLPRKPMLLVPALAVQFLGGVGLTLGVLTFWSSAALLAFMVPTTLIAHGFWRYRGAERSHHLTGFFQNLTMSGGLVVLLATGAGRWSIDAMLATHGG